MADYSNCKVEIHDEPVYNAEGVENPDFTNIVIEFGEKFIGEVVDADEYKKRDRYIERAVTYLIRDLLGLPVYYKPQETHDNGR